MVHVAVIVRLVLYIFALLAGLVFDIAFVLGHESSLATDHALLWTLVALERIDFRLAFCVIEGIGRLGRMMGVGMIGTAGEAQLGCQRSLRRAAAADQVIARVVLSRVLGGIAELGAQRIPQRRR